MGKRAKQVTTKEYTELDRIYRENATGDLLVDVVNGLPADDRSFLLLYVALGHRRSALARQIGVSWNVVDERLWRIQVVVKEKYEKLKKEIDDEDLF